MVDTIGDKFNKFIKKEFNYYFNKIFSLNDNVDNENIKFDFSIYNNGSDIDEIDIYCKNGEILIKSNTKVGLLIALYKFFELLGVRYLRPGRDNEYIPKSSLNEFLGKEYSLKETASYRHRGVCIEGADSKENVLNFIDWLPKIGMNTFFIQFENPYTFFKRWYTHEFNPYLEREEFSAEISDKFSEEIDNEMLLRGIVHHRVGHGWTGEVLGYQSKYGWESGISISDEKRHLVAKLNGEREMFKTAPILTSLCFENPEVNDKMAEIIVDYAKKRQDVDYLHVWLSDAHNNICECEKCVKTIPSDQYIVSLNKIDEELRKAGLNTKICFLLYHELLFPPINEKLNNPDRFIMMFAPISRTFEKSYADVDYDNGISEPRKYVRNNITLPNSLEENLSCLFNWKKYFSGDSFVYDYHLGKAHYGDIGYMKISDVIYRDVQYLDKLCLNGYISCQELRSGFPHNFPNYIMGKTLWNKNINYSEVKKEYFSSMYGNDWEKVVNYYEKLSDYSSCDYFNAKGDRENYLLSIKYESAEKIAFNFITEIEKNIKNANNQLIKKEWRNLSFHRQFTIKMAKSLFLLSKGDNMLAQMYWKDFLDYIRNNELNFQNNLDVYRIIEVSQNYTGFKTE